MSRFRLNRRALLKGAGGIALGLPWLEMMEPSRASAQTNGSPLRYVVLFAGTSLGRSGATRFVPSTAGANYDTPTAIAPLNGPHGDLRPHIGVVSNLLLPWRVGNDSPPGSRDVTWHSSSPGPLLSGKRHAPGSGSSAAANGATSDQLVANAFAGKTRIRSLQYRIQAQAYRGGESPKGLMSYTQDGSGKVVSITPISSIRLAYTNLVTGGGASTNPEAQAAVAAQLAQRKSVIDLVLERRGRLVERAGPSDRVRLDRYFTELRELEKTLPGTSAGGEGRCGALYSEMQAKGAPTDPVTVAGTYGDNRSTGFSDETARGRYMSDLIRLAFTCDMTRSVALLQSYAQCFMAVKSIDSVLATYNGDLHETGHAGGLENHMAHAIAWHVDQFAYLVKGLQGVTEGGNSLLDSCALALMFEGGYGYDPETGERGVAHSSENMGALFAGRAGGLKPGRHINANKAHPSQVLLSAMRAVGVNGPLGDITAPLEPMFTA